MTKHSSRLIIGIALVVALITSVTVVLLRSNSEPAKTIPPEARKSTPPQTHIVQHSSCEFLTREEMIDQADIIFLGKVISVSPTRWNQDSGEMWEQTDPSNVDNTPLQLHYVELEVVQPIATRIGLDQRVNLIVLGSNPLDEYADPNVHGLREGVQAVIFVRQTQLTWREGRPTVLMLEGCPSDAHLILADDGLYHGRWNEEPVSLEELLKRIAQRRETLAQP